MTPAQSIETCLRKYASFSGRATAAEFWWFWVAKVALVLIAGSVNGFLGLGLGAILFLPTLSAGYRRFADAGLRPWLIFPIAAGLILLQFNAPLTQLITASTPRAMAANMPVGDWLLIIGFLALQIFALALLIRETEPATNKYGPNPYEVAQ